MGNVGINMSHVSAQLLVNFVTIVKRRTIFLQCVKNKNMHELQENGYDSDIFLDSVETDQNVKDWKVNMKICDKTVNMKLDTGAQCNVLPYCKHENV